MQYCTFSVFNLTITMSTIATKSTVNELELAAYQLTRWCARVGLRW